MVVAKHSLTLLGRIMVLKVGYLPERSRALFYAVSQNLICCFEFSCLT